MLRSAIVNPVDLTGSDWNPTMNDTPGEQPDRQLLFLQEMIDENATIAGDVAEIDTHTWAIHGIIPLDGDVILAEFDTYEQARVVLDKLPTDRPGDTAP